jgi:hypothetical protein
MAESKTVTKKNRISGSTPCLYTLHIELRPNEIRPAVWRRLEVDGRISLGKLHHFIQAAFGWSDAHLHDFEISGQIYAIPHTDDVMDEVEIKDERKAFLNRLSTVGDSFLYSYDFGDNWEHLITVESVDNEIDDDPNGGAWVIDGARAAPPEDIGGPEGYAEFLEILSDPHSDDAQRLIEWLGGDFDPDYFDKRIANAAIMRMLFNRWGGK